MKTLVLECRFNKFEGLRPVPLLKEAPAQVLSHEFCDIFRASVLYNIRKLFLLVLVRIDLVWSAANLFIDVLYH